MADPLSDPLREVVEEYGESAPAAPAGAASSTVPSMPPAPAAHAAGAPAVPPVYSPPAIPNATRSPEPRPAARPQSNADISELRDGLAGMRTDLRQVPEQVGQVVSGSVLHAVSVALTEVRRPLEGMTLITEQLAAVLSRLEGVAGLKDQVAGLKGLPEAVQTSAAEVSRDLGALTSDINAVLTRVTSIDGRVATTTSGLETTRLTLADLERRLGQLDDTLHGVARQSSADNEELLTAVRDQVASTVREQLKGLVQDGVRTGIDEQVVHSVAAGIDSAVGPAVEAAVASAIATALEATYDEMLAHAIEKAQEALERRLVLHIDDAVMQLAEVIMRHQVQTLKSVTVTVTEESTATTTALGHKPLTDEEHAELDRLLTKITPPASLSDAVANAVARAGIGSQFARALVNPPPAVEPIPVVAADPQKHPKVKVPRSTPDADEMDGILEQWRDPERRGAALEEAKSAATAAVEAAAQAAAEAEAARKALSNVKPAPPVPAKKGLFGRKKD